MMKPKNDFRSSIVVGAALIAFALKLVIAYNTIGTNDVVIFYRFAKLLSQHSLKWTYGYSIFFNHPPLTAYYLRAIYLVTEQRWCQELGVHFPLLLRLPGIAADFLTVLVLLRITKGTARVPTWALALFAASPVSLMVSGFHGNTDPIMVLLLVCAVWMCLETRPVLAGFFFALGCQIKIVPLLFLPIFVLFWWQQRKAGRFTASAAITTSLLWLEPILTCPVAFAQNVLFYNSYWGIWGITYLLRLTGLSAFARPSFFHLELAQNVTVTFLKLLIIGFALVLAWRRRHLKGEAFIDSISYTWIAFFILAPGVCVQYLIWLAPFVLILSRKLYLWLLLTSSVFLFEFYNITAGGLPWSVSLSVDDLRERWVPWSLLPWTVLIVASIALRRKASEGKQALDPIELTALRAERA